MGKLDEFKRRLRPGQVYRRAQLAEWSTAVDRHIQDAVRSGALTKLAGGLYHAPKQTTFGNAPAEDGTLIAAFLKGDAFLLASPNAYNGLGVGTTQMHNRTVVYNHKRHGRFALGGRTFDFRVKRAFPKALSEEFLLVDLVNTVDQLGESPEELLERVRIRMATCDTARLKRAVRAYGTERTKTFFARALADGAARHAV
ncbi:MAG TPA: hypothetical protein VGM87_15820 [Roseomonas sp.]|jgi:hypothetical protein